jgi:DNA polymerase (family 10)
MVAVHNAEIADRFDELADLLEIENGNPFRVRAYRNASRMIRQYPQNFAELVAQQADLTALPGIGESLAEHIAEIVASDRFSALEQAKRRTPIALSTLLKIRGLGPSRVRALYRQLNIRSVADLKRAARSGQIRTLEGFGARTEEKILAEVERREQKERRINRLEAREIAQPLVAYLQGINGVKQVIPAGSYRRCKETVGDIDLLITASRGSGVIDQFTRYGEIVEVISQGGTRSTVRLRSGIQVDVRVVPAVSYGAALHYFTGSKEHNIALRSLAQRKGLKINEYGVFRGEKRIAGRTEQEVFKAIGLPFIEPELRENRGEIEAAGRKQLPKLIETAAIRGDFHCHTQASDGQDSIRGMAAAAAQLNYEYLGITDHSPHVTIAHGLDADRLAAQIDEIDAINEQLDGLVVLKSCEVDILADGTLDMPDTLLQRLDYVVGAIHYSFDLSAAKQTRRILKAMDNPHFNILAHPSGRLLNERPPYEIDLERVIKAAAEQGCFLELNAHPQRLDLNDEACLLAREHGVRVAIGTDAHSARTLNYMQFGVDQARRGWLGPGDVLNTCPVGELRSLFAR